ncbi:hypothetical protein [Thalassolituus oleivorans]|uniref:hypothetical protein n=1 Tax=Thalassolituus oleivorans TaxID=187493 RepID=UPI0023F2E414|nr:hypothetical protein [Thalassolituus oleivorans]
MLLDAVALPPNLYWSNEFAFKPVSQSKQRGVTGRMIIQSAPLVYGQPITLTGAWITRAELLVLQAMENAIDTVRTLTLNNGDTHSVLFDLDAGGLATTSEYPLTAPLCNPDADTLYKITINLITVSGA